MLAMVPEGFSASRVIDAGCGTGRLLALAARRWPKAFHAGIDIAPGMIRQARKRFLNNKAIQLIESDIMAYPGRDTSDLVLSSSALHWIHPFPDGIMHAAGWCRPGGLMALSVMLDGTLCELHGSRAATVPHKPPQSGLPTFKTLEQVARAVPGGRIRRLEHATSEYDLPSARDVIRSIHDMGVTSGVVSRGTGALTRGELTALTTWYDRHFQTPGGVRVTFVVGYLLIEC